MLRDTIDSIGPDRIQLDTVIRPPAEEFAYSLSPDQLEKIKNMLGDETEIIPDFPRLEGHLANPLKDEEVVDLLKRRPCTAEEISRALGYKLESVFQCLSQLSRKRFSNTGYSIAAVITKRNLNR
jgi:wyosine [tRNA(Phe)-imidazoG37] synthetase (radical SAM superfamily)